MQTTNEKLLDLSVSHAIGLQRYSAGEVRRVLALLEEVERDILAQLARYEDGAKLSDWSRKRLERLLDAVRLAHKEGYATVTGHLDDALKALAEYEAEFQGRMLAQAITINLDLVKPSASQLVAAVKARPFAGMLLRDWYSSLEESARGRVSNAIRMGFVEGETVAQVVRRLRGTRIAKYQDGALAISRRGAEMVARTAINHTATVARGETYKANAGVIKGVRWVSTLDLRTSAVCRARDGEVYPLDSGPRPPAHPNCRSTTVPVLKSWKEMGISLKEAPEGTRASMNGQVPASVSYDGWLRGRSVAEQEDVLGKTRADLFRRGKLTLDRFVDRSGREYTIEELRQREKEAFDLAFGGSTAPKVPKPMPAKPKPSPLPSRNAWEKLYNASLANDIAPDVVAAFEKTPPVALKNSTKGGFYQPSDHSIHMPKNWKKTDKKAQWIGTYGHEQGHAVDMRGDMNAARSVAMVDAITSDREAYMAGSLPGVDVPKWADDYLHSALGGDAATIAKFRAAMKAGRYDDALKLHGAAVQARYKANGWVRTDEMDIDLYEGVAMRDLIGSITDLAFGGGHSKPYYARFKKLGTAPDGNSVTLGHTAESFANLFLAHVSPNRRFWEFFTQAAAPKTFASFRRIIGEIANG